MIKSYWQERLFSGRATPPTEWATDEEMLKAVRANPAAIGYVAASGPLGAGIRVLEIAPEP
jgi:hypothetical protein